MAFSNPNMEIPESLANDHQLSTISPPSSSSSVTLPASVPSSPVVFSAGGVHFQNPERNPDTIKIRQSAISFENQSYEQNV